MITVPYSQAHSTHAGNTDEHAKYRLPLLLRVECVMRKVFYDPFFVDWKVYDALKQFACAYETHDDAFELVHLADTFSSPLSPFFKTHFSIAFLDQRVVLDRELLHSPHPYQHNNNQESSNIRSNGNLCHPAHSCHQEHLH